MTYIEAYGNTKLLAIKENEYPQLWAEMTSDGAVWEEYGDTMGNREKIVLAAEYNGVVYPLFDTFKDYNIPFFKQHGGQWKIAIEAEVANNYIYLLQEFPYSEDEASKRTQVVEKFEIKNSTLPAINNTVVVGTATLGSESSSELLKDYGRARHWEAFKANYSFLTKFGGETGYKIKTNLISEDSQETHASDYSSLNKNSWSDAKSWVDTGNIDHIDLIELDSTAFIAAYVSEGSTSLNLDIGIKDGVYDDGKGKGKLVQQYQIPFNVKYKERVRVLEACNDASGNLYLVLQSRNTDTWEEGALELLKINLDGGIAFRADISDKFAAPITDLRVDKNGDIIVVGYTESPDTKVFTQKHNGKSGELVWTTSPFEDAYDGFSIRNSERSLAILEDGTALIAGAGYFYPSTQNSQRVSNYIAEIGLDTGSVLGLHKVDDGHYTENDYWSHQFITNEDGELLFKTFKGTYQVSGVGNLLDGSYRFSELVTDESSVFSPLDSDENWRRIFEAIDVTFDGIRGDILVVDESIHYLLSYTESASNGVFAYSSNQTLFELDKDTGEILRKRAIDGFNGLRRVTSYAPLPNGGNATVFNTYNSDSKSWELSLEIKDAIETKTINLADSKVSSAKIKVAESGFIYLFGSTFDDLFQESYQGGFDLRGDSYIIKLDPSGEVVWAKIYGGKRGEDASDLAFLDNGDLVLIGETNGSFGSLSFSEKRRGYAAVIQGETGSLLDIEAGNEHISLLRKANLDEQIRSSISSQSDYNSFVELSRSNPLEYQIASGHLASRGLKVNDRTIVAAGYIRDKEDPYMHRPIIWSAHTPEIILSRSDQDIHEVSSLNVGLTQTLESQRWASWLEYLTNSNNWERLTEPSSTDIDPIRVEELGLAMGRHIRLSLEATSIADEKTYVYSRPIHLPVLIQGELTDGPKSLTKGEKIEISWTRLDHSKDTDLSINLAVRLRDEHGRDIEASDLLHANSAGMEGASHALSIAAGEEASSLNFELKQSPTDARYISVRINAMDSEHYLTSDAGPYYALFYNNKIAGNTGQDRIDMSKLKSYFNPSETFFDIDESRKGFILPIYSQPGGSADLTIFDSLVDAHKHPGSAERAVFLSNDLDLTGVGSGLVPNDNRYGSTSDGVHAEGFAAVYGFFGQYTTDISFGISGKNKFTDVITDAVTDGTAADGTLDLYLTSGSNGDAFLLHDAFSEYHKDVEIKKDSFGRNYAARVENINSIFAGDADDIIDLTTTESTDGISGGGVMNVFAGRGDDVVLGSNGNVFGEEGNDTLISHHSATMTGGSGKDIFGFLATPAMQDSVTGVISEPVHKILDFKTGVDSIKFYVSSDLESTGSIQTGNTNRITRTGDGDIEWVYFHAGATSKTMTVEMTGQSWSMDDIEFITYTPIAPELV